jgi:hypothetical protein
MGLPELRNSRALQIVSISAVLGVLGFIGFEIQEHINSPGQPPIIIKGGAMTFSSGTSSSGKVLTWIYSSSSAACADLDTTKKTLLVLSHDVVKGDNDGGNPPDSSSFPLNGSWEIDVLGRNEADGSPSAAEGISIKPGLCGGKNGVVLSPISGSQYSTLLTGFLGDPQSVRFHRSDCSKDEDTCEHMGRILLSSQHFTCNYGKCEIAITTP